MKDTVIVLDKVIRLGIEEFEKQALKFSLVPLDGKRPVEMGWNKYCYSKRKFRETDFLSHNAGVCCGPASGVLVLDIDDPSAFNSLVQTNGWVIPETYTVQTGSGKFHYYFQYPTNGKDYGNQSVKHPVFKKHTIFDIRGVGGQVVAAGSIHPATGKPYQIIKDVPAAPLPDWLVNVLDGNELNTDPLLAIPLSPPQDQEFIESLKLTVSTKQLILSGKNQGERSEAIMTVMNALVGAGYLSLLAASTVQTYDNTWDSSFTDIGFTNRLFIVPGTAKRKYAFPEPILEPVKLELQRQLKKIVSNVGNHMALDIDAEAKSIYHNWYMKMEQSIHAKRIDTYALRLMSLLAVNDLKNHIDVETVEKVIALCNWQLEIRKIYDPIDADNKVATLEEKIRRVLRRKPLKERQLKQRVNANRSGLWLFEMAKKNLVKADEIVLDRRSKKWCLVKT